MDRLRRSLPPVGILFAVSIAVHYTFLTQPGRPFVVDSNFLLSYSDIISTHLSTWHPNTATNNIVEVTRIPYLIPLAVAARLVGASVEQFVTFMFWFPTFLGLVTGYYAFSHLLYDTFDVEDRRAVLLLFLLAVFYALNPWIMKHFYHYYFRVSYAILPLSFLFSYRYVLERDRRYLVYAGVATAIQSTNPHFVVYFFVLLFGISVPVVLLEAKDVARRLFRLVQLPALFAALSAFWILPTVFLRTVSGAIAPGYIVSAGIVRAYSERNGLLNELASLGGYTVDLVGTYQWSFDPLWVYAVVFLTIPVLAFSYFVTAERRRDSLALASAVLILAMIALGTGYRYPGVVPWLYENVLFRLPFFQVLRAPDRFTSILALPLGYLIGRSILGLQDRRITYVKVALLVVVVSTLAVSATSLYNTRLEPTPVPDDYQYVENHDVEAVYTVPPQPLSGYDPEWTQSRSGGIARSVDAKLFAAPDSPAHRFNFYIDELILQGRTDEAVSTLRKLGVEHVLVRTDVEYPEGSGSPRAMLSELDGSLSRTYSGDDIVLYRLNGSADEFRPVAGVPVANDMNVTRPFAGSPDAYPSPVTNPVAAERLPVDGKEPFHPIRIDRVLNQRDALHRPFDYRGVLTSGRETVDAPTTDGRGLYVETVGLSNTSSIAYRADGRSVYRGLRPGLDHTRLDGARADGGELTFTGDQNVRVIGTTNRSNGAGTGGPALRGSGTVRENLAVNLSADRADEWRSVVDTSVDRSSWRLRVVASNVTGGRLILNAAVRANRSVGELGLLTRTSGDWDRHLTGINVTETRRNVSISVPVNGSLQRVRLGVFAERGGSTAEVVLRNLSVFHERPSTVNASVPTPSARVRSAEQVGPAKYRVRVDADEPYLLSFAEGYDPAWVAEIHTGNGTERIAPIDLYGVTNGFRVERTGQYSVTIRYRPQRWLRYGGIVSGLALVGCLGVLLYDRRRSRTDDS